MEDTRPEWGKKISKYCFIPARFVLAFMCFTSVVNAFTMRVCLSMAITRIVVKLNATAEWGENICPPSGSGATDYEGGDHDWSQATQGFILSSFYIGYVITHIPGGILAEKYGGKYVLALGILSTAIFTLLTPLVIDHTEAWGLILLRILIGFGEGTTFPAVSMLLGQWIPKTERAAVGALVLGGSIFGTVVANVTSGYILSHWKWPVVFYVFGVAGILWFLIFVITCFSDPSKHPYLKDDEKEFLMNELGGIKRKDLPPPPFIDIITSVPFLSMLLAQLGHDWGFFIMITDLPKYMNDVLRFSIKSNGLYSSVPFLTMYFVILLSGFVTDYTIRKSWIKISTSRRLNTAIGAIGPGIFMVAASYAGCDHITVVILFTCCMVSMAPYYSGLRLNPMDMSPNYAGTLMAISNGFAAITGAIAPTIAGLLTPNATLKEWRIVFWLSLAILVLTVLWYCFSGTGEIQPWNEGSVRGKDKEEKKEETPKKEDKPKKENK